MSLLLFLAIDRTMGLRVSDDEEDAGLDSSLHGESLLNEKTFANTVEKEKEKEKKSAVVVASDPEASSFGVEPDNLEQL